jgi:lysyl-tRNA synthetase class II
MGVWAAFSMFVDALTYTQYSLLENSCSVDRIVMSLAGKDGVREVWQ